MTAEPQFLERARQKFHDLQAQARGLTEAERREVLAKMAYLQQVIREEEEGHSLNVRMAQVFVSFAGRPAEAVFSEVLRAINALRIDDTDTKFRARHGMGFEERGKPDVLEHIAMSMKECSIFVGILTKEHELVHQDKKGNNFAPGSWAIIEAGMAIGLGLQVVFFIEEGVHTDFWFQTLGSQRHAHFEHKNRHHRIRSLMTLIQQRYRALLESRLGHPN